jgi:hypothetical protein
MFSAYIYIYAENIKNWQHISAHIENQHTKVTAGKGINKERNTKYITVKFQTTNTTSNNTNYPRKQKQKCKQGTKRVKTNNIP